MRRNGEREGKRRGKSRGRGKGRGRGRERERKREGKSEGGGGGRNECIGESFDSKKGFSKAIIMLPGHVHACTYVSIFCDTKQCPCDTMLTWHNQQNVHVFVFCLDCERVRSGQIKRSVMVAVP